jgi:hypothetical protein
MSPTTEVTGTVVVCLLSTETAIAVRLYRTGLIGTATGGVAERLH